MTNQEQLIQQLGALTAALENQNQQQAPAAPVAPMPATAPQMTVPPEMLQEWMQARLGMQRPSQEAQEAPATSSPAPEPEAPVASAAQEVSAAEHRMDAIEASIERLHKGLGEMLTRLAQEMDARFKHVAMRMDLEQEQHAKRMQQLELDHALLKQEQLAQKEPQALSAVRSVVSKGKMHDIVQDIAKEFSGEVPTAEECTAERVTQKAEAPASSSTVQNTFSERSSAQKCVHDNVKIETETMLSQRSLNGAEAFKETEGAGVRPSRLARSPPSSGRRLEVMRRNPRESSSRVHEVST